MSAAFLSPFIPPAYPGGSVQLFDVCRYETRKFSRPCYLSSRTARILLMVSESGNPRDKPPDSSSASSSLNNSSQPSRSSEPELKTSFEGTGSGGLVPPDGPKNNQGSNRPDRDGDDGKGDGHSHGRFPSLTFNHFLTLSPTELYQRIKTIFVAFSKSIFHMCKNAIKSVFEEIPVPVVAAIISAAASIAATRVKLAYDKKVARQSREEAQLQHRVAAESELRKNYNELTIPLLKAAAKLADHLYLLVSVGGASAENDKRNELSPVYSAYLVGRYLAALEILKNRNPLFDYGFPTADRILHNIVGRVQGIFSAGDKIIRYLQSSEQLFKPSEDENVLDGGLFKLTPRAQTVIGELLLRHTWLQKYDFLDTDDDVPGGSNRTALSFLEFSRIYTVDESLQKWISPLVNDFRLLESVVKSTKYGKKRNEKVGARIFFVQSGLIDLVTHFDPPPDIRVVPVFRRRRLEISENGLGLYQRMPESLETLFRELSLVRDYKSPGGDPLSRLRLPYGVEAHIASPLGVEDANRGMLSRTPCPESQEVLLILNEMNVPYKTVPIKSDSKPMWYYLLHPDNKTPLIYHDGNVIDDASNMLNYFEKRLPENPTLASSEHLNLRPSIDALTGFHDSFLKWIRGDNASKDRLESQLRNLNRIVERVQKINNGSPFFGGSRFSREDVAIIPHLHRVDVAGNGIKKWRVSTEYDALRRYLDAARNAQSFKSTIPDDAVLVESYTAKITANEQDNDRLADFLE